jgi:hypothetical protein
MRDPNDTDGGAFEDAVDSLFSDDCDEADATADEDKE